jgi:hypothetical protein
VDAVTEREQLDAIRAVLEASRWRPIPTVGGYVGCEASKSEGLACDVSDRIARILGMQP